MEKTTQQQTEGREKGNIKKGRVEKKKLCHLAKSGRRGAQKGRELWPTSVMKAALRGKGKSR